MNKTTRNAHSGISFLIVSFAIGLGTCLSLMSFAHQAQAQEPDTLCAPRNYPPSFMRELVPLVRQSESAPQARGIFVNRAETISFELSGDETICISSTPDGRGVLEVDDRLEIEVTDVNGVTRYWQHDFYDPNKRGPGLGGISPYPAQEITRKFGRGDFNVIRIVLRDFFPPWYSASPILVIIWGPPPTLTPTITPTLGPTLTSTPSLTPPTKTAIPSPTPTPRFNYEFKNPYIFSFLFGNPVGSPSITQPFQFALAPVEQGRPFTVTVDVSLQEPFQVSQVSGIVTDFEGDPIQDPVILSRQRKDNYIGTFPGINQIGAYSMTLTLEATEPSGSKRVATQGIAFEVGDTLQIRILKFGVSLLSALLMGFAGIYWSLKTFWWVPPPRLTGGLRVFQRDDLIRTERLGRYRSTVVTIGKRGSTIPLPQAKALVQVQARYEPPIKQRSQLRHAKVVIVVNGASSGNGIISEIPHFFDVDQYKVEYRKI